MQINGLDISSCQKVDIIPSVQKSEEKSIAVTNPCKNLAVEQIRDYDNWKATLGKSSVHFGNTTTQPINKEEYLNQLKEMKNVEGYRVYQSYEIDDLREIPDEKFKYVPEFVKVTKPDGTHMFSGFDIKDLLQLPDKQLDRVLSIFEKTKRFDADDLTHLSELPDYQYQNIEKFIDIKTWDNKPRFDAFDIIQLSKLQEHEYRNALALSNITTLKPRCDYNGKIYFSSDGKPRFNGYEILYLSKYDCDRVKLFAESQNHDGEPKYNIFEIEKLINGEQLTPSKENFSDTVFGKIKPIKNDDEYTLILENLQKEKSFKKGYWYKQNEFHTGIMPYAGDVDLHEQINGYLHTGKLPRYCENHGINTTKVLDDYIRCFDYACKKIDERYGKYHGFVYRYGLFDKEQQQYASCSTEPYCVVKHASSIEYGNYTKYPYHIIWTDNGHKINEVQKELGSDYAKTESEIILNPDTKYELVEKLTPEQEKIKQEFIQKIKATPMGKYINDDSLKIRFWKEIPQEK